MSRASTDVDGPGQTYYGRPVLKEPVWMWAVPAYFYVGGVAGAAATLGGAAHAASRGGMPALVTRCRWLAGIGGLIGSALLVYDLGRPERFLNMLRVFRRTSPLSVGSWVLAATTPAALASAGLAGRNGALGSLGDAGGAAAAILGLPLSGYTAVLLASTAVPVWQESRRSLPALFVASAASGATSLLELTELPPADAAAVRRLGAVAKLAELAAMSAVQRETGRVESVGRPLKEGVAGSLRRAATALAAASLVAGLASGRSRAARIVSGVTGTVAAATFKFAVFHAGSPSAADPHATFELQRSGQLSRSPST